MEYKFSECNEDTKTLTVFFYYDREKRCDMTISDALPPFMEGVPCSHLCDDGKYSQIMINDQNRTQIKCMRCPKNQISVKGGFIYDARMEEKANYIDRKVIDNLDFKTSCLTFDLTDPSLSF